MEINVSSEIGHLQGVIVHTPGHEVSLVNPELKDELLFDDIIFEDDARGEHLDMLDVFKTAMPADGKVIEILDIFEEVLQKEDARAYFIEQMVKEFPEANLQLVEPELLKLDPKELLVFITQGYLKNSKGFTLHPSPNLLFTRDLAAVVDSGILISRAAKKARLRESLLMETLVQFHPLFDSVRDNAIRISGHQSIEGGDVLVVNKKLVLIGMSERTSFSGLMKGTEGLLKSGVETVLAVDIPKQRSSMHLDTIFTFADRNECIAFPPAIMEQKNNVVALFKDGDSIKTEMRISLQQALEESTGESFNFIKCGGEDRTNQFREQWTDGANVFALAPGIIVGYERNTNTFNTLVDHGYDLMTQFEFVEEYGNKEFSPSNGQKIAISFQGHELCRGRGGARCMTLPISRKPLH
ncbi:arginine deiminase family protein [Gracilimonas mengyeensis]|uniref:arginine deiminase n=1 Tax=Gracilimonas mengyeensis TaxID=1302730 RepID=A0A521BWA3_9BACT|nr:arginine deiminase family protein [Gracilimonas mengyeensis]SMO50891.1 arginine deiminase [Gracilimonas mengyeensis]